MLIGALQKTTLIDYPGKIACVVFTQGCNFKCGYCHNPELVFPEQWEDPVLEGTFFKYLEKRKNHLEGVCITGGEPTLHRDLAEFIKHIRKFGLAIKLDTNGTKPKVIQSLLDKKLLDYIAMDIKGPLNKYKKISDSKVSPQQIKKSIKLVMESGLPYEFRTTVVKDQLRDRDFADIGNMIKGAPLYYLQKFKPTKTNNPCFMGKETYSEAEFKKIVRLMKEYVRECFVR